MVEEIVWEDYMTIGLYLAVVLAVGLWSTFRSDKGTSTGYFLAGKNMHWIPIGASIYASNVGAPMFVGMAGTAAASGFAVAIYEWHAVYLLIALGWLFVPVYVACGAEIYSGAVFMQQLLGWNIYLCVSVILAITAIYTIAGGLTAVIYTDTLQTVIIIAGAIVVTSMSLIQVGGWNGMMSKFPTAAANYTLLNQTFYKCGMPREDAFHIFRDPVDGDIPWTGAVFGLTTLGLATWCQDQIIVQRSLAAKNIGHAKAGSLLAGFLKLLSFLLFIIPGMISRILYPEKVACADPAECDDYCDNKAGCTNVAYPLLVLRILPAGVRGVMLAALMSALMSSLTSVFNSASSIMTLDLWVYIRKKATETELMVVGRLSVLVLIGISILWLPILQAAQGGMFWNYIQSTKAYLAVPWCILFLLGLFWNRVTEKGAFWGLMLGLVVGLIRMGLDFATPGPNCGSGDPDTRLDIVTKVDFLHFAIIVAVVTTIAMVVGSLVTTPRAPEKLHRVTWWTRHAPEEPELTDDEDETPDEKVSKLDPETPTSAVSKSHHPYVRAFKTWICGTTDQPIKHISPEEKAEIRRKLTSLSIDAKWNKVLNVAAIAIATFTAFFFGYFA